MLTFIDWFAGVGGFRKGMENAGHKCIGFCEFDKYAVASYTSMHLITEEQREYLATLDMKKRQKEILKEEYRNGEWYAEDVRTVRADEIPRADCWCFGFPCQDISVAGKQLGFAGHRSSLFFAVTKLIRDLKEESKPGWLFIENVKNLLSVNRGFDFAKLLVELDEIGYDCEWQLLNSKDHGVPQNRERVFIVGHLRGRSGGEVFPVEGTDGENCAAINQIGKSNVTQRENPSAYRTYDTNGVSPTLTNMAGGGREPHNPICMNLNAESPNQEIKKIDIVQSVKVRKYSVDADKLCDYLREGRANIGVSTKEVAEQVGVPVTTAEHWFRKDCFSIPEPEVWFRLKDVLGINTEEFDDAVMTFEERPGVFEKAGRHYFVDGIAPTLTSAAVDGEKIVLPVMTPDRAEKRQNGRRFKDDGEPMFTLTGQDKHGVATKVIGDREVYAVWYEKYQCYIAIRKLTPKECFRLQGWDDESFQKAEFVNSNSQLYKQAGNGVTVNVIEAIARKMQ